MVTKINVSTSSIHIRKSFQSTDQLRKLRYNEETIKTSANELFTYDSGFIKSSNYPFYYISGREVASILHHIRKTLNEVFLKYIMIIIYTENG